MSLDSIIAGLSKRITEVKARVPSYEWASVAAISPVTVVMDSDATGTPIPVADVQVANLAVDDRVEVRSIGSRRDVIARAGGTPIPMGGTPVSTNIVVFIGDSITVGSGASANRGYANLVRWRAGTRPVDQVVRIYATAGYTSSQVLATHVPTAIAGDASVLHVQVGTNDAGTGVTVAQFAANVEAVYAAIVGAGKRMTIGLIPPRASGATSTWRQDRAAYNEWISRWAPLVGVPVADTSTLADATGNLSAAYDSGDGTHPNDAGYAVLAEAVTPAVLSVLPTQPHRPSRAPDVNLMPTTATPTTVAAGLPAGWVEAGTGTAPTYSTVADTSGTLPEGTWVQMDFNATAGGTRTLRHGGLTLGSGWTSSDQIEAAFVVQVEDVSGFTAAIRAGTASVRLLVLNTGATPQVECTPAMRTVLGSVHAYRFNGPNTTYPSLAVEVTAPTGTRVKVRIGALQWRNLTALGVTKSTA